METPDPKRDPRTLRRVPDVGLLRWSGGLSPHDRYATSKTPWQTDLSASPPRGVVRLAGDMVPELKVFWMFHAVGDEGSKFRAKIWGIEEASGPQRPHLGCFLAEAVVTLGGPVVPDGLGGLPSGTRFAHEGEIVDDQVPFPGAALIMGGVNKIQLWHEPGEWSAYVIEMGPDLSGGAGATRDYGTFWRAYRQPAPLTDAELRRKIKEADEREGGGWLMG